MKTFLVILFLGLGLTTTANAQDSRYALIVANNASIDPGVPPLRFADDDGARFFEIFSSYADQTILLTTLDSESQQLFPQAARASAPPSRENLLSSVSALKARIDADRKNGKRAEVFVVFTGHGNRDESGEGYLSLSDERLRRSDLLRNVIEPLNADFTHVIIDACNAYFMVNSRGDGWKDDRSGLSLNNEFDDYLTGGQTQPSLPTVGVILSTAGAQEVHEWSVYGGGVFSHQLRSALLGAADADGDGSVTYPEIEAYLVAANASVTNPRARIHVHVRGPAQDSSRRVVDLEKLTNSTTLEIAGGQGPMWIEDSRGLRYADLNLASDGAAKLRLMRATTKDGSYWLRTVDDEVVIPTGEHIALAALERTPNTSGARGAVNESFRQELFKTSFGPGFLAGFLAARNETPQTTVVIADAKWNPRFAIDYQINQAILDVGTIQHALSVSADLSHVNGLALGGFAEYGFGTDSTATLHRLAAGVQLGWGRRFGPTNLGLQLRAGPEVLLIDGVMLEADPIALRADTSFLVVWQDDSWSPFITGGVALDVVTRAGIERNSEQLWFSPHAGIGVRF